MRASVQFLVRWYFFLFFLIFPLKLITKCFLANREADGRQETSSARRGEVCGGIGGDCGGLKVVFLMFGGQGAGDSG